jgi:hypothetical protein
MSRRAAGSKLSSNRRSWVNSPAVSAPLIWLHGIAANVDVHEAMRAVAACRLAVVDGEVLDRDLLMAVNPGRLHLVFDQLAKISV